MAEKVKDHDFIEIDYTGKLTDGSVFDTTSKKVAEDAGLPTEKAKFGPMIICVGEEQVLPGLDEALVDKEVGKEFTVNIPTEKAFGKKDIKKMKIVPIGVFKEHQVQPQPGLQIDVDGEMGTVMRVSGGRVIVNFNHPLAGREVVYEVKVNRKVTDQKEQLSTFLNSSLRIPEDKMDISITEGKAEVKLPLDLPEQFTNEIGKKLAEITKLKEVKFLKSAEQKK